MAKVAGIDLKVWGVPRGSLVMDLGAASGVIANELAHSGLRVKGVEYDPKLVEEWRSSKSPDLSVEITQGDGRKLPYKDSEFDGALALEVMEHIPETEEVLAELSRVIKKGGKLVVGVPTEATEKIFYQLNPDFAKQADHVHVFAEEKLKDLIEKHGFKIYAARGENSEYTPLWLGLAWAKTPFHFTGKTYQETLWEKIYWKALKFLEIIKLRGVLAASGDKLWPRSIYLYAEKI